MNYYHNIEEYCEGRLGEAARADFEQAMKNDTALAGSVAQYSEGKKLAEGLLEIDIMETIEGLEGASIDVTNNDIQVDKQRASNQNYSWIKWIILLLAIGGLIYLFNLSTTVTDTNDHQNYASLYDEPFWPVVRSNEENLLARASAIYLQGDISTAKNLLLASPDNQTLNKFWIAEMYLRDDQIDSSLLYLPNAQDLPAQQDRINYLRSIIAINNNDYTLAKKYCNKLPKEEFSKLFAFLKNN